MTEHTMEGKTICGGYNTPTTCMTLISGEWVTSHDLLEKRWDHSSWGINETHTVLLGGGYSSFTTSETVLEGENFSQPGFTLQHKIK